MRHMIGAPRIHRMGPKIAFASGRGGSQEIYIMNTDGSEQIRLTDTMGFNDNPSYSPDGSKIAFTCRLVPYNQVCVIDTEGPGRLPCHQQCDK